LFDEIIGKLYFLPGTVIIRPQNGAGLHYYTRLQRLANYPI